MQPSLAEQLGLRNCLETPDSSLGARFPQLPADATIHDRLMRDEVLDEISNFCKERLLYNLPVEVRFAYLKVLGKIDLLRSEVKKP